MITSILITFINTSDSNNNIIIRMDAIKRL